MGWVIFNSNMERSSLDSIFRTIPILLLLKAPHPIRYQLSHFLWNLFPDRGCSLQCPSLCLARGSVLLSQCVGGAFFPTSTSHILICSPGQSALVAPRDASVLGFHCYVLLMTALRIPQRSYVLPEQGPHCLHLSPLGPGHIP